MTEINLAWALADAVKPHLNAVERSHLFVAIGAGETFPAIRHLLKLAAVRQVPVRPDLVQQCASWLRAYVGHTDERYLRHLIHAMATPAVSRTPTMPRKGQVVSLAAQRHRVASAPAARLGIRAGTG
jgi:hypothetical protein